MCCTCSRRLLISITSKQKEGKLELKHITEKRMMVLHLVVALWLIKVWKWFFFFFQHTSAHISKSLLKLNLFSLFRFICIVRAEKNDAALPIRRIIKVLQVLYPSIIPSVCIHNLYTLYEDPDWCFNAGKQTMLERVLCDIPLSILFISRNRDASPVMLAGSQAWHWGFLTHHALFIVQSNRVCKMRITQHEENRGKGDWGRSGGEQRKERGAKVRARVEERDPEERRERGDSGRCQNLHFLSLSG